MSSSRPQRKRPRREEVPAGMYGYDPRLPVLHTDPRLNPGEGLGANWHPSQPVGNEWLDWGEPTKPMFDFVTGEFRSLDGEASTALAAAQLQVERLLVAEESEGPLGREQVRARLEEVRRHLSLHRARLRTSNSSDMARLDESGGPSSDKAREEEDVEESGNVPWSELGLAGRVTPEEREVQRPRQMQGRVYSGPLPSDPAERQQAMLRGAASRPAEGGRDKGLKRWRSLSSERSAALRSVADVPDASSLDGILEALEGGEDGPMPVGAVGMSVPGLGMVTERMRGISRPRDRSAGSAQGSAASVESWGDGLAPPSKAAEWTGGLVDQLRMHASQDRDDLDWVDANSVSLGRASREEEAAAALRNDSDHSFGRDRFRMDVEEEEEEEEIDLGAVGRANSSSGGIVGGGGGGKGLAFASASASASVGGGGGGKGLAFASANVGMGVGRSGELDVRPSVVGPSRFQRMNRFSSSDADSVTRVPSDSRQTAPENRFKAPTAPTVARSRVGGITLSGGAGSQSSGSAAAAASAVERRESGAGASGGGSWVPRFPVPPSLPRAPLQMTPAQAVVTGPTAWRAVAAARVGLMATSEKKKLRKKEARRRGKVFTDSLQAEVTRLERELAALEARSKSTKRPSGRTASSRRSRSSSSGPDAAAAAASGSAAAALDRLLALYGAHPPSDTSAAAAAASAAYGLSDPSAFFDTVRLARVAPSLESAEAAPIPEDASAASQLGTEMAAAARAVEDVVGIGALPPPPDGDDPDATWPQALTWAPKRRAVTLSGSLAALRQSAALSIRTVRDISLLLATARAQTTNFSTPAPSQTASSSSAAPSQTTSSSSTALLREAAETIGLEPHQAQALCALAPKAAEARAAATAAATTRWRAAAELAVRFVDAAKELHQHIVVRELRGDQAQTYLYWNSRLAHHSRMNPPAFTADFDALAVAVQDLAPEVLPEWSAISDAVQAGVRRNDTTSVAQALERAGVDLQSLDLETAVSGRGKAALESALAASAAGWAQPHIPDDQLAAIAPRRTRIGTAAREIAEARLAPHLIDIIQHNSWANA